MSTYLIPTLELIIEANVVQFQYTIGRNYIHFVYKYNIDSKKCKYTWEKQDLSNLTQL